MNYSARITKLILIIGLFLSMTTPIGVQALNFFPNTDDPTKLIKTDPAEQLALGGTAPTKVALDLTNVALSLLGGLCLVMLLYGGFIWIWARGNQEQIEQAKEIIRGTVIGLVIVMASLGVTRFVFVTIGQISGAQITTGDEKK